MLIFLLHKKPHGSQISRLCITSTVYKQSSKKSKMLGSLWNCLWGHALKKSPGINNKSRVLYSSPRFLSSATWYSMPKTF